MGWAAPPSAKFRCPCRRTYLTPLSKYMLRIEIPINKELLAGYDPRLEPAPAGKFTPSALMVGAGISATFDADKLLGIIFSKKMRAKARNAKEADAWKSY